MNISIKEDLWTYLARAERPIVMYGMGNGADKILKVCEHYGIEVSDFFASDGFVRGHSFHGKTVLSYSAMKEKYRGLSPIVLLSFASSLDGVIDTIRAVAEECELYAPDVPVFGDTLFNIDFFNENRERFERIYSLLADEESKKTFENVILYKLSGKIDRLFDAESDKETVYRELLRAEDIVGYCDVGAYNGDTIRELSAFAPKLSSAVAIEPDRRNFKKLSDYALGASFDITCINAGAWSENTVLSFDASGNRNAGFSPSSPSAAKGEARAVTVDSALDGQRVDYIKYDVEGSEREALIGSRETIRSQSPKLLISLYHRSEDMFALPELLLSIDPQYKLYLRRFKYIPAWDLNLYAIK